MVDELSYGKTKLINRHYDFVVVWKIEDCAFWSKISYEM